jgi:CheY-like chemotaxis protein
MLLIPAARKILTLDRVPSRPFELKPVPPELSQPQLLPQGRKLADVLPAPVASPAADPELHPLPLAGPTPAPILILEEDLSIRKLLRRLLERRGYPTVEIAQAGDLAGELLDRPVDLLIVDVSAVESGVEAVVKLARALPNLKILALSAQALKESELPGRLLVLPKPFPLDSFIDSVDGLLGGPKAPGAMI